MNDDMSNTQVAKLDEEPIAVLETPNGVWLDFTNADVSRGSKNRQDIEVLGQTAFGHFLNMEQESGLLNGARYLAFKGPRLNPMLDERACFPAEIFHVSVRVSGPEGGTGAFGTPGTLVTGFANANPFPLYADDIAALSEHLGIALSESDYPHRKPEPEEESRPPSRSPGM